MLIYCICKVVSIPQTMYPLIYLFFLVQIVCIVLSNTDKKITVITRKNIIYPSFGNRFTDQAYKFGLRIYNTHMGKYKSNVALRIDGDLLWSLFNT